jgi:hypothetical protein
MGDTVAVGKPSDQRDLADWLGVWIPEKMDPGTIFILERCVDENAKNPFVAVMSCPKCGTIGLITRRQLWAGDLMICCGDACSAEYRLDGEKIIFRKMQ